MCSRGGGFVPYVLIYQPGWLLSVFLPTEHLPCSSWPLKHLISHPLVRQEPNCQSVDGNMPHWWGRGPTTGLLGPFVNTDFGRIAGQSHEAVCTTLFPSALSFYSFPCHLASKSPVHWSSLLLLDIRVCADRGLICLRLLGTGWINGYKHVGKMAITAFLARWISNSDPPEKDTWL